MSRNQHLHRKYTIMLGQIALVLCVTQPLMGSDENSEQVQRPNIVVLFVDDLGWSHVGFQDKKYHTPHIDRLMQEGMFFTDAYSASPTCSPSRSALITGRHPARLRIVRHIPQYGKMGIPTQEYHTTKGDPSQFPSRNWLPLEEKTMAEALKPFGYKSVFVGKWHLGHEPYHPIQNGFDEQYGVSNFGHPGSYHAPYWPDRTDTYKDVAEGKYLTDQLTDDAVDYLKHQEADQPFLMTFFYYSVHTPNQGRADLVAEYEAEGLGGRFAHHAAQVSAVDESVGRIRNALQEQGLADNTVIVFFSDQGGLVSNSPLRGGKAGGTALYEGSARVPLVFHQPKWIEPGSRCSQPVLSTDIVPTMVDLAGGSGQPSSQLDGVSLMPLLTGQGELNRDAIFMYRSYESQYAAMRSGPWKLIAYRDGQRELFNLENDLAEQDDLAAKLPERVEQLSGRLRDWEKFVHVDPVPTQE